MLISDKYRRPWSDAAHYARRLFRAYDISSAIRSLFADDVTYGDITDIIQWLGVGMQSQSPRRPIVQVVSFCVLQWPTFIIIARPSRLIPEHHISQALYNNRSITIESWLFLIMTNSGLIFHNTGYIIVELILVYTYNFNGHVRIKY